MMLSIFYTWVRINKTKKIKWIMVMSAGIDEMHFKTCNGNKILMAEFTLGTLLGHVKQTAC